MKYPIRESPSGSTPEDAMLTSGKPSSRLPEIVLPAMIKRRRERSGCDSGETCFCLFMLFHLCGQFSRPVDGLADTDIGSATAEIVNIGIDIIVTGAGVVL